MWIKNKNLGNTEQMPEMTRCVLILLQRDTDSSRSEFMTLG